MSVILVQNGGGSTLPLDPATIAVYVLLAVSAVGVWYANRQAKKGGAGQEEKEAEHPEGIQDPGTNP